MFVKPTSPDSVMWDPKTGRRLPPDGMRVTPQQFWTRRIRDGDVVVVDPPGQAKAKAKPAAKAKG